MSRYAEVADVLRREIEDDTYPPGSTLPTLVTLRTRFNASNTTIREAIKILVNEGLVYTAGSRGTIVRRYTMLDHDATRALRKTRPQSGHDVFVETVMAAGRVPHKLFEMKIAACPDEIAERLRLTPGALTVIRSLTQRVDDQPWMVEVSWYPRDLAEAVGLDVPYDIVQGTMRALAEAGHKEVSWRDEITTRAPTPYEARQLEIPAGVSLMIHTRTASTADRITRVTRSLRPGDRNRIVYELGQDTGFEIIVNTRTEPADPTEITTKGPR